MPQLQGALLTLPTACAGVQQEDFGDWDLREALADTSTRQRVCAVVFGHMHHRLNKVAGGGLRNMAALDPTTSTVYLNAAVVPRHDRVTDGERGSVQVSRCQALGLLLSKPVMHFWPGKDICGPASA